MTDISELKNNGECILLTDRVDDKGLQLLHSLQAAGYRPRLVSIDYDGFLPEGACNPFAYYTGALEADRTGTPLYFDRIQVPKYWEIRSDMNGGNIYDYETRRAKVFFANPKNKRCVRIVDWMDGKDRVRVSDHYDRFGKRYAQTVLTAESKPVLRTYYDAEQREVITENFVTRSILLHRDGKEYIFDSRTAFCAYYLKESGFDLGRIFYNSLSYPFFVSEYLGDQLQIPGQDILFWQEPVGNEIPGNMRGILSGSSKRSSKVIAQSEEAYRKLLELGAPRAKTGCLGYIYHLERSNTGTARALILTNSDQIEQLDELARALPKMQFYVGALTEMSPKLMDKARLGNVILLPGIRDGKQQEMFDTCDFYLDINRGGEILDAVRTAFMHHQLILGFQETMHNADYVSPWLRFPLEKPSAQAAGGTYGAGAIVSVLKRAVTDRAYLSSLLGDQLRQAMNETPERYRKEIERN